MITEFSPVQNGSVLYYADLALSGGDPSLLHGFATRRGGVSTEEHLKEMNLGFFRGEARALTEENYARFASAVGIPAEHLVFANQTHTHRIAQVGAAHHGVGVTKPPVYFAGKDANDHENEVDALVSAERGVALGIRVADCVPILYFDPCAHVIGAAHAGWRGTLSHIAALTLYAMEELGACAGSIRVAIGPCIGRCCYEVDHTFYEQFLREFGAGICQRVFDRAESEHPHADLSLLNELLLSDCGVKEENIHRSALCTCCNGELFHSHRASGGVRGTGGALIYMKED